jgi:hypothetical protein
VVLKVTKMIIRSDKHQSVNVAPEINKNRLIKLEPVLDDAGEWTGVYEADVPAGRNSASGLIRRRLSATQALGLRPAAKQTAMHSRKLKTTASHRPAASAAGSNS